MIEKNNLKTKSTGRLEVICGSMFSGKTEELIRRIKRVEFSNQNYIIFRPKTDSRNPNDKIISHAKTEISAITITEPEEILTHAVNYDVIGIDEGQFFNNTLTTICNTLANSGHRVIVAGLDMDYKGNPFGPMPNLMAIAEEVTKVHAVCVKSGELASYSFRKNPNDDLVMVGEKAEYEPLSRRAFINKMAVREKNK
ncbi:MAG: thymidine kinase [Bacteroidetes bacterium]|jgi:thymidine kinase|nr:MAG: thymidine kinase [Cryomorphaceae bacterium BACL29 MAG-121220-bin8]MDA0758137.1 thymidine kinase [Bacteroidota bacterium]|tara:strand:- start:16100 stop:16690 length:591 start_codon:yes stop_codon:yes gene_type:complete